MKRRAIVIGASPQSEPLENVSLDVATWIKFLASDTGGAWDIHNEIIDASNKDKNDLLVDISESKNLDYSIVVFAGHGVMVNAGLPWPELNLVLQSGEMILERDLNPGTPYCTLVLDCCRKLGCNEESLSENTKSASIEEAYNSMMISEAYKNSLFRAEKGLVKVYATGEGYAAADYKSFSQFLIHYSQIWSTNNYGILSIKDAVALAADQIVKTYPQQLPEYQGGRRLKHFPFALSL